MPEYKTTLQLPALDISQPLSQSSLSSLSSACKEWGFFRIINHGVSKDLYRKLYFLADHLFNLPCESKIKIGPSSSIKTYTPHFIASPFFESLRVSGPDFFASAQTSSQVLFHHPNPEFSEAMSEYGNKMSELSKRIVKAVLISMGDDFAEKFYESDFNKCHGYMRINKYSPAESAEEVEGLGMHTDMSCMTIVCQDDIGGLQVRSKLGKWMDINPCEDTLVVNIGDLMHAWSNGKLRSSEHRVVLRRQVHRFSLAFFWCFEDDKVIFAPNEVVGEGNLRMYKPFVCRDYLNFRESSEKGKFDKVGFTIKDFAVDQEKL
ncbi:gibberellin 20-oxidase-like protein [Ricinus communis]|uniref:Gibberellin 20-oxidase, putative n=1 Tax=Ricinus communis TaxID=3988 RepID=B9R9V9_RICCO|nr:gibberellin 20-oxidase-like protein [Ricinus communis]EEF51586.1 gibberellin 20-oxidase, putative [Ricinus communis]|eukprot:XP_002510984.1 gibberellin 20-oxidase-like protein isoform X1 [Ricinus communis]